MKIDVRCCCSKIKYSVDYFHVISPVLYILFITSFLAVVLISIRGHSQANSQATFFKSGHKQKLHRGD